MRSDSRKTLLFVVALLAALALVYALVGPGGVPAGVATPLVVAALVVAFLATRRYRR